MIDLRLGDCREALATMPVASVDACVTDPPYGLGFMGKGWDRGVPGVEFWAAVFRVLKPGAHLLAFSGTRTQHRMVCAIEDAGFEIRDQIGWAYGSGFPKSHNLPGGWGTALKPAWEPICVARKPLIGTVAANVLRYGTGAINIDGCRILTDDNLNGGAYSGGAKDLAAATSYATGVNAGQFVQPPGRWPANLIHDGSDEVLACFPQTKSGSLGPEMNVKESTGWAGGSRADRVKSSFVANEGSAARFFYCAKASKADRGEGNKHPTVKPTDLMRYLCRLVTPPGGTVLDPFMGSGSTGKAATAEGFKFIGVEMEAESMATARRRLGVDVDVFT